MTVFKYEIVRDDDYLEARIEAGGGAATAKLMRLEGNVSKLESFSTPPGVRGTGGLSYALVKLLLEQCEDKVVRVEGVHGFLHTTLRNLKFAKGAWRLDPTYKGEKDGNGAVIEASRPKQTCDYATYTPDISLWLAMMKCVEKGISLVPK